MKYKVEVLKRDVRPVVNGTRIVKWVKDFEANVAIPFLIRETLDGTLDTGRVELIGTTREEPLEPFTPVKVVIKNDDGVITRKVYMLVYNDAATLVRSKGEKLYNHTIDLVEPTKILERISCQNMAFSKSAKKTKIGLSIGEPFIPGGTQRFNDEGARIWQMRSVISPINNQLEMHDTDTAINPTFYDIGAPMAVPYAFTLPRDKDQLKVYLMQAKSVAAESFTAPLLRSIGNKVYNATTNATIQASYIKVDPPEIIENTPEVEFNYQGQTKNIKIMSESQISSLVDGLNTQEPIAAGLFIRIYGVAKIAENTFSSERYAFIDLRYDKTFNLLSESDALYFTGDIDLPESWTVARAARKMIECNSSYGVDLNGLQALEAPEMFTTGNTLYESLMQIGGYIHAVPRLNFETSKVGFERFNKKTVWSPQTSEVIGLSKTLAGDTFCSMIESDVANMTDSTTKVGDSYEGSIKERVAMMPRAVGEPLTTETAVFKTSLPIFRVISAKIAGKDITKMLYEEREYKTLYDSYQAGDNTDSKLGKLRYTQGSNIIDQLFYKPTKLGIVPDFKSEALYSILKSLYGVNDSNNNFYQDKALEIEYVPYVKTRLRQVKSDSKKVVSANVLKNNQSAGAVESEYVGASLKGLINRLGQTLEEETITLKNDDAELVPGAIYNGKSIVAIDREYDLNLVTATLTLSKDFNRLSERVALESSHRLYDISEVHNVDRYITFDSYIAIDDAEMDDKQILTGKSPIVELKALVGLRGDGLYAKITANDSVFLLPVTAHGIGNTIILSFGFKDNYSAGERNETINNLKFLKDIRYGTNYGRLDNVSIEILRNVNLSDSQAMELPILPSGTTGDVIARIDDYRVDKDGAETLHFLINVHLLTPHGGVVLGELFAEALLCGFKRDGYYYALDAPDEVGMFDRWLEPSTEKIGAIAVSSDSITLPRETATIVRSDGSIMLHSLKRVIGVRSIDTNREIKEEVEE